MTQHLYPTIPELCKEYGYDRNLVFAAMRLGRLKPSGAREIIPGLLAKTINPEESEEIASDLTINYSVKL